MAKTTDRKTIVVEQIGSPIRRPGIQRATFEALKDQTSPRSVAQRRGKKVADLLGRGGASAAEAEAQAEAITE